MKNLLDQHFSEKLKDLEIPPSKRANELFARKVNKRHTQWKYFTAAASVVLLASIVYLNSEIDDSAPTAQQIENAPVESAVLNHFQEEESPVNVKTEEQKFIQKTLNEPVISAQNFSDIEPKQEEILVRRFSEEKIISTQLRKLESNLVDYTLVDALQEKIEIEAPKMEVQEELKEKKLLTKIVEEAKYVANGEKPDLDRAGIKPAATMAIHKNGFIANEKQQIRESVNRIKDFLSK